MVEAGLGHQGVASDLVQKGLSRSPLLASICNSTQGSLTTGQAGVTVNDHATLPSGQDILAFSQGIHTHNQGPPAPYHSLDTHGHSILTQDQGIPNVDCVASTEEQTVPIQQESIPTVAEALSTADQGILAATEPSQLQGQGEGATQHLGPFCHVVNPQEYCMCTDIQAHWGSLIYTLHQIDVSTILCFH